MNTTLSSLIKSHHKKIIVASACSIANKLCDITPELLIALALDTVVNQQNSLIGYLGIPNPFHQIGIITCLTAVLWIFESFFEYSYLILWKTLAQDIQQSLRTELYSHIQNLDSSYFLHKTTGSLLSVIIDDTTHIEQALEELPNLCLQLLVNIIVIGTLFLYVSPFIALVTLIPIPGVIVLALYFQKKLGVMHMQVQETLEKLTSEVASKLLGISTIKQFVTEKREKRALENSCYDYKKEILARNKIASAYIPLVRMIVLFGFIMNLFYGGIYALNGSIALSSYSLLIFLSQRFLWPFTSVTTITNLYEKAKASSQRISMIFAQKPRILGGNLIIDPATLNGDIQFNNVTFNYGETPLFNALSCTIPARKTVAFVGTSGSGKSTLSQLLLRSHDILQGSISLDNFNIQDLTLESLRKSIAIVSQDSYLVPGTIAENIAYGTSNASMEDIIEAAQFAQADTFIKQLPEGYLTHISENGKNFSGGQKQRIAIARAYLKNAPIIIFDEATSALDNETERELQKAIAKISHKKTVIIIAHRLSNVQNADTIFVLDKGVLVEQGSHEALVERNGYYKKLLSLT